MRHNTIALVGLLIALAVYLADAAAAQEIAPAPTVPEQARGLIFTGLIAAQDGPCRGMSRVAGTTLCTHGPDAAPPGTDVGQTVEPLPEQQSAAAAVCQGDGVFGKRVQVAYVRAADAPDRYAAYVGSIRSWAAQADELIAASAAEVGGVRNIRFVTDGGCAISVANVVVSRAGATSLDATVRELHSQGLSRSDRLYLVFMDANVYCGIAGMSGDDRPGESSLNNRGPNYARIDAGCWGAGTAVHELLHNLGAVQLSAPHTTGGFHCADVEDVMCYSDAPRYPAMQSVCPPVPTERIDCGHDDYYHPSPPAGSYLATHWNTADSAFLWRPDARPPDGHLIAPRGGGGSSSLIALGAEVDDHRGGSGVYQATVWAHVDGSWRVACTMWGPPWTCSWDVAAFADQRVALTLQLVDNAGLSTDAAGGQHQLVLDRVPPQVDVAEPDDRIIIERFPVDVTVAADDGPVGSDIAQVEVVYQEPVDGRWRRACIDTEPPYSCPVQPRGYPDGVLFVYAWVTDHAGNVGSAPRPGRTLRVAPWKPAAFAFLPLVGEGR